jgi:hypothetical protein
VTFFAGALRGRGARRPSRHCGRQPSSAAQDGRSGPSTRDCRRVCTGSGRAAARRAGAAATTVAPGNRGDGGATAPAEQPEVAMPPPRSVPMERPKEQPAHAPKRQRPHEAVNQSSTTTRVQPSRVATAPTSGAAAIGSRGRRTHPGSANWPPIWRATSAIPPRPKPGTAPEPLG